MTFARASREADWHMHIHILKLMLPYFVADGHWHYLIHTSVYLIKMTKLPENLLKTFFDGEHAMWHQNSLCNSIGSDVMIETTAMQYMHSLIFF